ncbi:hypothetical protein SAMN04489806_3023 [Paramicrobacterium humi]|uniref:Uncharacterized protein n=1 Tax=Paramicrobacterium humi TaxID=640635 RepID=A0A1H4R761_9MICO|nr:hypothetical protein [Microbacterium humi]SEC27739.1 hypothetical protein SAMN04489806_3023 [Microbacterium humi]
MVPTEKTHEGDNAFGRFFIWVDDKLTPIIGSANVGPYDESARAVKATDECPVCRHAMSEHTIDHSTPNAVLHCPAEAEAIEADVAPLNELGMPTDAARRRAGRHAGRV